jgi:hypothetical protein
VCAPVAPQAIAAAGTLLTADVDDMHPLADHFRSLRVIAL